jgi:hypothetical protein
MLSRKFINNFSFKELLFHFELVKYNTFFILIYEIFNLLIYLLKSESSN